MLYLYDLIDNLWFNSAIMFASLGVMVCALHLLRVLQLFSYSQTFLFAVCFEFCSLGCYRDNTLSESHVLKFICCSIFTVLDD